MSKPLKKPSLSTLKEKSWGTIIVSNDTEIDHWVQPMPAGTESCPSWYSMRLFKGTETSPGTNKTPEYWLGICNVFLAPILPIPIISDEIVIKLGDSDEKFRNILNSTNHAAHNLLTYTSKYADKIINKATVKFEDSDIKYNNDSIWTIK